MAGSFLTAVGLASGCGDGGGDTIIIVNVGGALGVPSGGSGNSGGTSSGGNASGGDASGGDASGGDASGGNTSGGANPGGGSGGGGVIVDCMGEPPTSVRGIVRDPSGTLPLYNVAVYVPNGALPALADGASGCARCADWTLPSSMIAMTNAAGEFSLEGVPAGSNVPLVIETGKWRRAVTIPSVTACADNEVDAELTRLPRNQSEGHLPKIAVVRGASDTLECLIHALGVDNAEVTADSGTGRVHLYYSSGGSATPGSGQLADGAQLALDTTLYASLDKMKGYGLLIMGCSGSDAEVEERPPAQISNLRNYAAAGGRILGSHFHVLLIDPYQYDLPYPTIVNFASGSHGVDMPTTGELDTSFPRGAAFSAWLGSTQFEIPSPEHNVNSVTHANARAWVTTNEPAHPGVDVVEYFSFPVPIDGPVCGRMAFTSMHIGNGSADDGKVAYPTGCLSTAATLTPQQRAFAFLFFDLNGCVEAQEGAVTAPTPR